MIQHAHDKWHVVGACNVGFTPKMDRNLNVYRPHIVVWGVTCGFLHAQSASRHTIRIKPHALQLIWKDVSVVNVTGHFFPHGIESINVVG